MPKHIYLCDDDPDDRELFVQALDIIGSAVSLTEFSDGDELILQLYNPDALIPDIIFLDINMFRKDGIRTLMEIKSHTHLNAVPVVVITTSVNTDTINAAYSLGAHRYVIKPTSFNELISIIRIIITGPMPPPQSISDYLIATRNSL